MSDVEKLTASQREMLKATIAEKHNSHLRARGKDCQNSVLYKREVDGLIKGSKYVKCSKLTLIVLEGERQTIKDGEQTTVVLTHLM